MTMQFVAPDPEEFLPRDRVPDMAFMVDDDGVAHGYFLPMPDFLVRCCAVVIRFKTDERALVRAPEGPREQVLAALRRAAVAWVERDEGAESVGTGGFSTSSFAKRARRYGKLPSRAKETDLAIPHTG